MELVAIWHFYGTHQGTYNFNAVKCSEKLHLQRENNVHFNKSVLVTDLTNNNNGRIYIFVRFSTFKHLNSSFFLPTLINADICYDILYLLHMQYTILDRKWKKYQEMCRKRGKVVRICNNKT